MKSPFVPRPPEITTFASVSSGLPPLTAGLESVIVTSLAFSEITASTFSKAGTLDPTSASIAEGRIVITGIPALTFEETINEPPKTDWVALRSEAKSIASVTTPLFSLIANLPAISFPAEVDGIKIASGFTFSTT